MGQGSPPSAPVPAPRKNAVTALLQPNSVLSGVMLPRYDENRRIIGVFRANTVTLVTQDVLDGKTITMELFDPDRSPRGRLDLTQARYNQVLGTLHGTDATKVTIDNITATGTGLAFVIDRSEGFLMGPVVTRIKPPPQTAMRSAPSPLRATALLSASLLAMPVATAEVAGASAPVPPASAAPVAPRLAEASAETRDHLRAALTAAAEANRAATAFLDSEELLAKTTPAPQPAPAPKVLDVKPGPDDTIIDCDGGMYFDGEKGVLVYLEKVTVDDPNLTLAGANDLKVFFEKKPEKLPAPAGTTTEAAKKTAKNGIGSNLGEVERIIATGSLYLRQKPTGKDEPIEATCNILAYDKKTGEIILTGSPVVKQGGLINRGKRPDQTVRITKDAAGSYHSSFSPGGTVTILPSKQLQKKPKVGSVPAN